MLMRKPWFKVYLAQATQQRAAGGPGPAHVVGGSQAGYTAHTALASCSAFSIPSLIFILAELARSSANSGLRGSRLHRRRPGTQRGEGDRGLRQHYLDCDSGWRRELNMFR